MTMRIFALSDVHVDHAANASWIRELSAYDYRDDLLILAGDVADRLSLLSWCLSMLAARFRKVLFVPGNHDLWVMRDRSLRTSLEKFAAVRSLAESCGASMRPYYEQGLAIFPLLAWYDYSFGEPCERLKEIWMDYYACQWPAGCAAADIAEHFLAMNEGAAPAQATTTITFSHFVPRIDLMPASIPAASRLLYPVLGTSRLDSCLRRLGSSIHVYGHTHVNRALSIEGVRYVNNAFGYPRETGISAKRLVCIR
jgi:predicted phosphodiesterase